MAIKQKEWEAGEGFLPTAAPLANPYVPYQQENPPKYEAHKGLVRGTLFPGLDLPFLGKVNQKPLPQTATAEMQALSFAIQELALYLDTHSEDTDALKLYREYQTIYNKCKEKWNSTRMPLDHSMKSDREKYAWLEGPWPWEYSAYKEG